MNLTWLQPSTDSWYALHRVDLTHRHFYGLEGVYVIWQGGGPVVRVGQGVVGDRLGEHKTDEEVNAYDNLHVTWAIVPTAQRDGVERYLADKLNPRVGGAFPRATPIAVNLPWPYKG